MNKGDLKLLIILFIPIVIIIICLINLKDNGLKKAVVYYENKVILTIDLNNTIDNIYDVLGYNGNVKIVAKNGKVKVSEENSPKHICSNQGWISESYQTIVCLPNKIIIRIESSNDYDTIVG